MKSAAKKTIILYVLNILKLYSSSETPVTQTAICSYLNDIDICCDRKTVGRNIEYLVGFGYPIKRGKRGGYYLSREDMQGLEKRLIV